MPTNQSIESWITEIGRALVEMEAAVHFQRPVEQWQRQSSESVDVDVNGFPTKRQDHAKSDMPTQDLLRSHPKQYRRSDFAISVEIDIGLDREATRRCVGVNQATEGNAFGSIAACAARVEI